MSWRSSTPPEVVEDIDSLTDDSLEAAADFLSKRGSFAPFMLTIALSGHRELRNLGSPVASSDEAGVVRAFDLPDDINALRARACVLDVVAREPFDADAIKVMIEHRSGLCMDLLVPYRLSDDALEIDMDRANAARGEPFLWGRANAAGIDPDQ